MLLMPHPYLSDLSSTPTGRYGIPPQDEGYSTFDPEPLTNKAPWSTPSPVSYGRKSHSAPEPSCKFPRGYAAGYDIPMPLLDSPPQRWHGTYKGKGKSRLMAAADGDKDMGGAPGGAPGPAGPTGEERLEQARNLYNRERQQADRLEQEIEALRHGGRPGRDPLRRRGPLTHRFSIP